MQKFREIISDSFFQGIVALLGLLAFIVGNSLLIKIPAAIILIIIAVALRSILFSWLLNAHKWLLNAYKWLTWKFFLGILFGILSAFIFSAFLTPAYNFAVSIVIPQLEVVDFSPSNGQTLERLSSQIKVHFSREISPRLYYYFLRIEITPKIPLKRKPIYIYDPETCCNMLYIGSDISFDSGGPQFEPDTTYNLRLSGPLLKKPFELEFNTPS